MLSGSALVACLSPRAYAGRIELPGAAGFVTVWNDTDDDGTPVALYTINLAGRPATRPRAASHLLRLRHARFDPLVETPDPAPALTSVIDNELWIVQFVTRPIEPYLEALRNAGARPQIFLADQGWIVRITSGELKRLRDLPFVRWVGPMHPGYKLEEAIVDMLAGSEVGADPTTRYSILLFERGPDAQERVVDVISTLGGVVHGTTPLGSRIEATLSPSQLLAVARRPEVLFIDRKGPMERDMDIVREIGGGAFVHTTLGLTGEGVRGEMMDTELDLGHPEWLHTPLVHLPGSDSPHGTAVFGIMFAQGLNPRARGLLPAGQGIYAYCRPLLGGGPTRYEHTAELVDPGGVYQVVFQTSSTGDPRTTEYTTISAEMDDILFLYDILVTQSQSNAGDQQSRPQAWAKNIVACGGIKHMDTLDRADDRWDNLASIGPAADGRIKPDLAHFCDYVYTTAIGGGYTATGAGTSVATPIVAGHFGLLFQMWHEGIFSGFGGGSSVFSDRPHMTTAKAMLINSAFRYDWHQGGPNADLDRFKQGWGMPDLRKLYDSRDRTFIVDETDLLEPFESRTYLIDVTDDDVELRVTLVYADPRGNPASAVHRINDLSLRVIDPEGSVYWGNAGLIGGNWSTPGGASNTIDTVENVFVPDPAPGVWTVEVIADEINEDSHVETPELDADFALVAAVEAGPVVLDVLWDNGPLVSHPGQGAGGADASVRESVTLGEQYMGYGHHLSANARVADDFEVVEDWIVREIDLWAYQIDAGAGNPTITAVNLRIWDGPPTDPASRVVFGDSLTNVMSATSWDNLYRVDELSLTTTSRAVYRNTCTVPDWTLPPGHYWLDWQSDGVLESGPWVPPVSIPGQTHPAGANALQLSDGVWHPAEDPGSLTPDDFKFVIRGWISDPTIGVEGAIPSAEHRPLSIRPNPFSATTTIGLSLPRAGHVSFRIYDVSGRLVRVLVDGPFDSGPRSVTWDGRDGRGRRVLPGTYFYHARTPGDPGAAGKIMILN